MWVLRDLTSKKLKMKVKFLCTLSTDSINIRRDTPKRTEDFSI